ncbi:unnamed protein product [Paramecium pentaurelia]|uniref:RING-type domain-containing protein n=1 Tax=Paramecium pentaurelia TaxID=43138 RepID=A0A8S1SZC2_9CILI|nr:unnamed protein product [Paramecium pentaurelia]
MLSIDYRSIQPQNRQQITPRFFTILLRNMIISFYDQLQIIKFRILKEKHTSFQQNDCPICYQQINESHSVIQMPCHQEHYFHAECCRQWLERDPNFPLQVRITFKTLEISSILQVHLLTQVYGLQDHKETRKKQIIQWGEIVHLYFQSHKVLESSISEILNFPIFQDSSSGIIKRLDSSEIKEILNQMSQLGSIEWKNDQIFSANLVSPFELADAIYAWAKEKKLIGYTETLQGITEGSQTDQTKNFIIYLKNKFSKHAQFEKKLGDFKYMNLMVYIVSNLYDYIILHHNNQVQFLYYLKR